VTIIMTTVTLLYKACWFFCSIFFCNSVLCLLKSVRSSSCSCIRLHQLLQDNNTSTNKDRKLKNKPTNAVLFASNVDWTNQPTNQATKQPTNQPTNQPPDQLTYLFIYSIIFFLTYLLDYVLLSLLTYLITYVLL
jgi:hypothetical protein